MGSPASRHGERVSVALAGHVDPFRVPPLVADKVEIGLGGGRVREQPSKLEQRDPPQRARRRRLDEGGGGGGGG